MYGRYYPPPLQYLDDCYLQSQCRIRGKCARKKIRKVKEKHTLVVLELDKKHKGTLSKYHIAKRNNKLFETKINSFKFKDTIPNRIKTSVGISRKFFLIPDQ